MEKLLNLVLWIKTGPHSWLQQHVPLSLSPSISLLSSLYFCPPLYAIDIPPLFFLFSLPSSLLFLSPSLSSSLSTVIYLLFAPERHRHLRAEWTAGTEEKHLSTKHRLISTSLLCPPVSPCFHMRQESLRTAQLYQQLIKHWPTFTAVLPLRNTMRMKKHASPALSSPN